jgi:phosphomannomutase
LVSFFRKWGKRVRLKEVSSHHVTGSHIPADRNGIKLSKCTGEILKFDEERIREQVVEVDESIFREEGFWAAGGKHCRAD